MSFHKSSYIATISLVAVGGLLLATDPRRLPVVVLVLPPLLLGIAFAILSYRFMSLYTQLRNTAKSSRILFSLFSASFPIILVVLKSIDQLTIKDLLLAVGLLLLLAFYVSRFKPSNRPNV